MAAIDLDLRRAGVRVASLKRRARRLQRALRDLDASPDGAFLRVIGDRALQRELREYVSGAPGDVTDVVQLGIGGSSLGGQALCTALLGPGYMAAAGRPGRPRYWFPDNIDPESFGALLDRLDPRRTLVHVVSKSGGTLETLAQLHAALEHWRAARRRVPLRRNWVITTGHAGPLREFADAEGIPVLSAPAEVAGRFSVFTASGLLVPALCGVPVSRVLAGARDMESRCRRDAMLGPAGRLAALHHEHQRRGRRIHVELIYADALLPVGDWFRQIWAESLGKDGEGPTPVVARGTTDQHSQLQLYVDGPDDKLYTALLVDRPRRDLRVGRRAEPAYIRGKSLGAILDAEARGTLRALVEAGRPLAVLRLPRITAQTIGGLLLMQQLQTALAGPLYGVNPFDQPGVEAGKRAARRLLERS